MNNENKFYVVEGDNGTGKSTLVNYLVDIGEYKSVTTPTPEYKKIREYIHNRESRLGKFLYYVSSVCDASIDINNMLKQSSVVCDRYIASSIVDFLIISGSSLDEIADFYKLVTKNIAKPDITFLLRCDHNERVKRVVNRATNVSARDDITEEYSRKTNEFYDALIKMEQGWHVIDTTRMRIEDVLNEADRVIKNGIK